MGAKALDPGIKMELVAVARFRLVHQPLDKALAMTPGPGLFAGNQIVHIHEFPPRKAFGITIAGERHQFPFVGEKRKVVARALLTLYARYKFSLFEMRTQLRHDRKATDDFRPRGCQGNRHNGLINQSFRKVAIGVDAPIPQEGPMRPGCVHVFQIERDDERFLFVGARLRKNLP